MAMGAAVSLFVFGELALLASVCFSSPLERAVSSDSAVTNRNSQHFPRNAEDCGYFGRIHIMRILSCLSSPGIHYSRKLMFKMRNSLK